MILTSVGDVASDILISKLKSSDFLLAYFLLGAISDPEFNRTLIGASNTDVSISLHLKREKDTDSRVSGTRYHRDSIFDSKHSLFIGLYGSLTAFTGCNHRSTLNEPAPFENELIKVEQELGDVVSGPSSHMGHKRNEGKAENRALVRLMLTPDPLSTRRVNGAKIQVDLKDLLAAKRVLGI